MSAEVVYRGVEIMDWEQRTRRGHDSMDSAGGKQTDSNPKWQDQGRNNDGNLSKSETRRLVKCPLPVPAAKSQQGYRRVVGTRHW